MDDGWSDAYTDSELDEDADDESNGGYWAWLQQHEATETERHSRPDGSSSSMDAPVGRPSQYNVDAREFAERCFAFHGDNQVTD